MRRTILALGAGLVLLLPAFVLAQNEVPECITVRAEALLRGRLVPSAEDVRAMAAPVLSHRMALSFAARARGESIHHVINTVADQITTVASAA